ncbi:heparinase II/III family protein [Janthinobacterium sp.]|uniref:heparinase II/III domain-containing protein n=1 Tax=Janthinobacterium sp. TaxID=1871054 RepID=UPI00293D6B96|nr:heparinase II/III family protein [Janthinobacterium sp.]
MVLQLRRIDAEGVSTALRPVATKVPRLLLTSEELGSGTYEWTVSYTKANLEEKISTPRRFVIAAGAVALPSGAALAQTVANKASPRALPDHADFAKIVRDAKAGEYGVAYKAFSDRAKQLMDLKLPLMPAMSAAAPNSQAYLNWKVGLMHDARIELEAIETLAYAGRFQNTEKFEPAGIARLLNLAKWDTRGVTGEVFQEQANREVYLALALGLDLFGAKLDAASRKIVVDSLVDRLGQVQPKFATLDQKPYDPHLFTDTCYFTEALMYVAGLPEFQNDPQMRRWLENSWETYITMLGVWGGSADGGFANGGAYGWYALTSSARMMAAAKLIAGVDVTPLPAAGRFGDNQIAFTPPAAALRGQFGDDLEARKHYANYSSDAYRLYASVTGKPEHEWYWRADPSNVSQAVPLQPMHYLLLALRVPGPPLPRDVVLPRAWVFEDAGLVAMHSATADPRRSSVFFRSSRFGSSNHAHADNNAFTFVSKGREMLISGGYYTGYDSDHHAWVTRATRFKNALTFDGGIGQAEPDSSKDASGKPAMPDKPGKPYTTMEARGGLINFGDTGTWAYTTGDATLAYQWRPTPTVWRLTPTLDHAIRSVAYHRTQGVVVIYDWAVAKVGQTKGWELNFNFLNEPFLRDTTLHIVNDENNERVEACVDIYGPAGHLSVTKGFPVPPPPDFHLPDQYQARWRIDASSRQLVAVTVIREDCRPVPVVVAFQGGNKASVTVDAEAPLLFDEGKIFTNP